MTFDSAGRAPAAAAVAVGELARAAKPLLRGWLHAVAFPLVVAAGTVLVVLAPDGRVRAACGVYLAASALLFGVSAVYHRGRWSPRALLALKRFDHANIFLIIAGTYTPFAFLVLQGALRIAVLAVVWAGAVGGIALSVLWPAAPRWLLAPIYIGMGWAGVFVVPQLLAAGPAVLTLVVVGGGLYSVGGLIYALRRPDPAPRIFGFHEIFHALTIAAYIVHYVAVSLAAYRGG
jgi:hemolysin III